MTSNTQTMLTAGTVGELIQICGRVFDEATMSDWERMTDEQLLDEWRSEYQETLEGQGFTQADADEAFGIVLNRR